MTAFNRRSIRLKGYDYSQNGAYFVTIVTKNRKYMFGDVIDGSMVLNEAGEMVEKYWQEIPIHFQCVKLDEFVIMPNHIHGIIIIDNVGAKDFSPKENGIFLHAKEENVGAKDFSPTMPIKNTPQRAKDFSPLRYGTTKTIGSIIRGFKIGATKWIRLNTDMYEIWQRNYHERIIRHDKELNDTREYIINNPINWMSDENFA